MLYAPAAPLLWEHGIVAVGLLIVYGVQVTRDAVASAWKAMT
jgi:hypothetical protein